MAEEALPIVRGYQYSLRMAVTGGDAAIFPDGAKLRAQVREFAGSPRLIAEMTFQNGGLRRVSNDTVDLVMSEDATRAIGNSSAIIEFSRTDVTPYAYLYIMLRVPVMKDQILSPVVVTVKPALAVSLSTPPAFFGGLTGVLQSAGSAIATLASLASTFLAGSAMASGSAVATVRTLLGSVFAGSAVGVCTAIATLASQSAIMMAGSAVGTAAAIAMLANSSPADVYDLSMPTSAQSFKDPSGAAISLDSVSTYSSTGPIVAPDTDGKFYTYAAGTKAINGRGWWRRAKTRNNRVRNINTGAVAGSPGTMPTGHAIGAVPAGMTRTISFGANHPVLNLPYIRIAWSGTPTAAATVFYKALSAATIPGVATDCYVGSGWMQFASGSMPIDGVSKVNFVGSQFGSTDAQSNGAKLLNRSLTEGPTRFKMATRNGNARTTASMGAQFVFKAGTPYDLAVDFICFQFEQVDALTDDASLPILNDAAAGTTITKDTLAINGPIVSHINSGEGFMELTSDALRGSGLEHRQEFPLISVNGGVMAMKRGARGEIVSEFGAAPKSALAYLTQYGWEKTQAVSWGGGNISVASGSAANTATAAGAVPSITSIAIEMDGCIKRLRFGNKAYTPTELSAFKKKAAKFVAYGATMGGLHHVGVAKERGFTGFIVGTSREVNPGGMGTGGLSVVDAISPSSYQSSWGRDYLNWVAEYSSKASLDNGAADSDIALLYCDYFLRKFKIDIYWTTGAGAHLKEYGIAAAEVTGAANNRKISKITTFQYGQEFTGKHWSDASYEGHLIRTSGCTFTHGREAETAASTFNGKRGVLPATSNTGNQSAHQMTIDGQAGPAGILTISPHIIPGDTTSGLITGVWADDGLAIGAADRRLQAFCYRMTTTTGSAGTGAGGNFAPMTVQGSPPPGYLASNYEHHGRNLKALTDRGSVYDNVAAVSATTFKLDIFLIRTGVATKSDFNNFGGSSIDGIGWNNGPGWRQIMLDAGIANPSENFAVATNREQAIYWQWQWNYQVGLFYWWAYSGDPRIPAQMALDAAKYGLPTDMYLDPHPDDAPYRNYYLYVREAIRLIGDDICQGNEIAATGGTPRNLDTVGISSYARDSHNTTRIPYFDGTSWKIICDGNVQAAGNPTAPLSAKWFMPKKADITNMIVTFCASVDHMAMGSFRMEMTQAEMGQSMGLIQCLQEEAGDTGALQDFVANNYASLIRPALIAKGIPVPQTT